MRSALAFITIFIHSTTSTPLINTKNGEIEGVQKGNVNCFLGIPFAKAPIGELRFKFPEKAEPWKTTLKAIKNAPLCPQLEVPKEKSSEDCLFINVVTPTDKSKEKLPVMVYIHGGAYIVGGNSFYDCEKVGANVVAKGVILVHFQYRLNLFGFFTTDTPEFPANIGMMDQIAAMRWVVDEIEAFGGDPQRITLFGESAGSKSVSLHTYSPLSRGLFQQVIMESGTVYCPATLYGNQNQFPPSSKLTAIATGCISKDNWDLGRFTGLSSCIKQIPWEELLNMSASVVSQDLNKRESFINWAPRVGSAEGFMPMWPKQMEKERTKDMPVIIGANHDENYYWYLFALISGKRTLADFGPQQFQQALSEQASEKIWGIHSKEINAVLSKAYTPNAEPKDKLSWLRATVKMASHRSYISGTLSEAKSLTKVSNRVYLYSLDYISDGFPWPTHNGTPITGAFHSLDEVLLFNEPNLLDPVIWKFSSRDKAVAEQLATLWTNFAKTGDPNQPSNKGERWERFENDGTNRYYRLDTQSTMEEHFHAEADRIWNQLIPTVTRGERLTMPRTPIDHQEL